MELEALHSFFFFGCFSIFKKSGFSGEFLRFPMGVFSKVPRFLG